MSEIVIKVENLSKQYRIGEREGYKTFRETLMNIWKSPFKKIAATSIKSKTKQSQPETIWALKDVSFNVKRGEVVGVIGRNGAGKTTLLKILSKITLPTEGRVELRGVVGSLLEVGTGFHPELTGHENIYLYGAILGMDRWEVTRKFDEIVAFAELEKFIDTPIKRYSSGMYMRLAFAVAAHLEPEILLVDEVLAVGDFAFQKKCLGKMEDVSKEGRTVLFVSHNMGAVNQLCSRAIVLRNGLIEFKGSTSESIKKYLKGIVKITKQNFQGPLSSILNFQQASVNNMAGTEIFIPPSSNITLSVTGYCEEDIQSFRVTFSVYRDGIRLLTMHDVKYPELMPKGKFISEVTIPKFLLRPGEYSVAIGGYKDTGKDWIFGRDIAFFQILEEWTPENDFADLGIINAPPNGKRKCRL
jgi:lipopolysaccharide transport system ATP-binding protein